MKALIWMLTWLPLAHPALLELPKPVSVTLTLSNFSYILKWEHGPGTPRDVYYSVSAATTRQSSLVPVAGCEHVLQPLVCNMTKVFRDPRSKYTIHVTGHLEAQTSQYTAIDEFSPLALLDLPQLKVSLCNRSLCVDLRPPLDHLREIYAILEYQLQIKSKDKPFYKNIESLSSVILEDLVPGRQYCVSVCFADYLEGKTSNFSQPVCVVTPAIYAPDPFISATVCVLLLAAGIIVVLLVSGGFICLKRRPLPSFLTSIPHIEQVVIASSSSFLNVKLMAPSADEKRISRSSSDESDEESTTEDAQGSSGGNYQVRGGANPLSSSSSTLSALTCLSSRPESPPRLSKNEPLVFFNPLPKAKALTDAHVGAGSDQTMTTDTNGLTRGRVREEEEQEELEEEGNCQDVNIFTLTFGRLKEEEEVHVGVPEVGSSCAKEECEIWDGKEFATDTVLWCSDVVEEKEGEDEDEEEEVEEEEEQEILEHNGYMGR